MIGRIFRANTLGYPYASHILSTTLALKRGMLGRNYARIIVDPEQVELAMKYAKIRPRRQVSESQRQRLRDLGMLRQKALALAVGRELTS